MYIYSVLAIITGLILITLIVNLNYKVCCLTKNIKAINNDLKIRMPILRELIMLCHDYVDIWRCRVIEKLNNSVQMIGEIAAYYIIHKLLKKQYEQFYTGWSIARLFF